MKRKTILMLSMALIAVVLTAVGTSYALFKINVTSGNTFKFVTGTLTLQISDTEPNGNIIIDNLVPMSDAAGMNQTGYSFTLTNNGSINASYKMYLDDVVPSGELKTRLSDSLIRINLTNTTTNTSNTYTLSSLSDRVLETGTLPATTNNVNNYVLRIWLDQSATNAEQNKYFAAKIRIEGKQENQVPAPANFATDSWETIAYAAKSGNTSVYAPTNTGAANQVLRPITLNLNGTPETHYLRVANTTPCTTETSQTACGLVIEFADIISMHNVNPDATNTDGYPASAMFTYINNTLLPAMPAEVRSVMKPVTVVSSNGITHGVYTTSNQYLYLLSHQEVFGVNNPYDCAASTTRQLDYYALNSDTTKKFGNSNKYWWLRTPYLGNVDYFAGGASSYYSPTYEFGVSPAFRVE